MKIHPKAKVLKEVLKGILSRRTTLVIGGHPGVGKTILASTLCYDAMSNGFKCLYVGLNEDKDSLYENMLEYGADFRKFEGEGLFKFVRIPVTTDEGALSLILDGVSRELITFMPKVMVVDPVNPLLESVKSGIKARALVRNYFYEISRLIDGTVVLVAEIPSGEDKVGIGDIEFVSDVLLILESRVVEGSIVRYMKIRKTRNFPVASAELPYIIKKRVGIVVLPPAESKDRNERSFYSHSKR